MISILLNWTYIFITAFLAGFSISKFAERTIHRRIIPIDNIVLTGLIAVTVYAQFFSLAHKVGFAANGFLLLTCMAALVFWRSEITSCLADTLQKDTRLHTVLRITLIILWSYCTSRGYIHYDSDLYHAQSIRWIEEYGIVKGLGNIHVRFAYNSSFFAVSALYSMKFLLKQSLHTVNGFLALILSFEVLKIKEITVRKKVLLSDFARIGAFFYLTRIYVEIISPSSDYAIMCIIFLIVIKWIVQLETDRQDTVPFALLCVAGTYAVSLKLTAGLILLLTVKPAYLLLRKKQWKEIALYFLMGLLILLPWVIRTAIISGYLLYPFPQLDLLKTDWKIPSEIAATDAAEIKTWGRGLKNAALVNLPISEWFSGWFHTTLPALGKCIIVLDMICVVLFVLLLCYAFVKLPRSELLIQLDRLFVLGTVIVCYLFWQLSAPLLRYGYAYVLLVVVLTAGITKDILFRSAFVQRHTSDNLLLSFHKSFVLMLCVLITIMLAASLRYLYSVRNAPNYLWQADYGTYALQSYDINGVTFYYPESGDRVGYHSFPAIPKKTEILFRSDQLADGFYSYPLKQ